MDIYDNYEELEEIPPGERIPLLSVSGDQDN